MRKNFSNPPFLLLFLPLHASSPGVRSTEVRQSGPPGSGGLQQVEAGVDVGPDPLKQHLRVFRGYRGQVQRGPGGRVCLPGPEKEREEKRLSGRRIKM